MSFGTFLKALGKGMKAAAKESAKRKAENPPKPKSFPVLTPDMLTPPDKVFTKAEAVKLYEMFVLEVGSSNKEDAGLDALDFGEQMDHLEERLKEDIEFLTQEHKDAKASVAEEKADLRAEGWSRAELSEMMAQVSDDDVKAKVALEAAKEKLAEFKRNRRGFLVAYVNNQIHGTPMPDM